LLHQNNAFATEGMFNKKGKLEDVFTKGVTLSMHGFNMQFRESCIKHLATDIADVHI